VWLAIRAALCPVLSSSNAGALPDSTLSHCFEAGHAARPALWERRCRHSGRQRTAYVRSYGRQMGGEVGGQTAGGLTDQSSSWQGAASRQQTADSGRQTADSRQRAAGTPDSCCLRRSTSSRVLW